MGKYNKEIVEEICKLVENGVFNKDAAECNDISEETFYNWQRPELPNGKPNPEYHPEFSVSLKKAEAKRKKNFILAIAMASNKSWQAAAWYLERVYNEQFARREIKDHKGKVEIEDKNTSKELKKAVKEAYEKFRKDIRKPNTGRGKKNKALSLGDGQRKNAKG